MIRRLATALAVCVAIGSLALPQRSRADIIADTGSANGIALCGKLYAAGHDPSGLWGRLNGPGTPPVKIITTRVPTNGAGTGTRDDADGIQIFWDPTHDITKDGVTSTPCEALYHELQHAADDVDKLPDSFLDDSCSAKGTGPGKGIAKAEWRAVAAQNAYRASFGLPPQLSYHGTPFGPGTFDDCKKNHPPGGSKKKSTNSVFGDPHLATTDGLLYDLQQVGEFTAFHSADPAAPRVQVRTTAVPESKVAALVSGVAAGSSDRRVAFVSSKGVLTISSFAQGKTETITLDDGALRDLGGGLTLSAAAATDSTGRAYVLRWAEGSELRVNDAGWWGLRISFDPSVSAKVAQPQGLLGNFNADPADDLTRPDGRRIAPDASQADIRSEFGDAWRISQADSLFPYATGESTDTFTDRAFPAGEPQLGDTTQARSICQGAGSVPAGLLSACVLDLTVTGNPVLAQMAAVVAQDVSVKLVAGQAGGLPQSSANDFGSGKTVSGTVNAAKEVAYTFNANAGDVADIRSECTPSGKGLTYGVKAVDSSGSLADPVGRVDGCTNLGRVAFATTAAYQLVISGEGQYRINWQPTPGDQRQELSTTGINAGRVVAATRHHIGFTVSPGQQWTFTPAAGCTQMPGFVWQVLDADGGSGGRGILDGCQPIGPLTLAPGKYDLRIDAQTADASYSFTAQLS
ncbi:VWD domain-containing protein [Candidatus Mycobacterium wuenschmannii]|uniref:VWD domain-containing protein n=1 Tax=Candidatus Mycobacterium wuenschmannii TaxID=3027808 RepID=A0ABY8W0N3_9MYCO|nr:VWD domain-containing protein [Candidatus Mycobacterium wuenschmannii]WIM89312.1 VWD domain-containing protein [Candidatus Mycobacterium wuenschmannii]